MSAKTNTKTNTKPSSTTNDSKSKSASANTQSTKQTPRTKPETETKQISRPQMPKLPVDVPVVGMPFHSAIDHVKGCFLDYVKQMGPFVQTKREDAQYIINSSTGRRDTSFIMSYHFANNEHNSVAHSETHNHEKTQGNVSDRNTTRYINMARFLTNTDVQNQIIDHYWDTYKMDVEIFQVGYNKQTKRYSKACIKFYY